MATNNTEKKVLHLFRLMELLANGRELYKQDTSIQEEFGKDERTIDRYLKDIHSLYSNIIVTEKKKVQRGGRKVTVYRAIDPQKDVADILKFFIENDNSDIIWILQMLNEQDPTLLSNKEYIKDAVENTLKKDKDIFIFNSRPFEMMDNTKSKEIFNNLKKAVKEHEYRDIIYNYQKEQKFENVKCLKMIFTQNNWYLFGELENGNPKWFRISFIKDIQYSHNKIGYQKSVLDKYQEFFKTIENAMTLYGVEKKTAHLKAQPNISHYFKKDMKKFFKSQKFIKENSDGSVEFTIKYTQPLEILPFIKNWAPSITILAPKELQKAYISDLQKAIEKQKELLDG